MKKMLQAAVVAAAVLAVPSMSLAAQTKPAPAAKTSTKPASAATHSAKGVVKSMDASSLVVTEHGKDVSYTLDASTKKEGDPAVGSNVTVTYKTEGTQHVATDVKAAPAKAHPAKK